MENSQVQYTDQLPDSTSNLTSFMDSAKMTAMSTNFINNKAKDAAFAPELAKLEAKGIDSSPYKNLLQTHVDILQGNPISQQDYDKYVSTKDQWDKLSKTAGTKSLDDVYHYYAAPIRADYEQMSTQEANNYGFGSSTARFVGGLAGSLVDPVNVGIMAASFLGSGGTLAATGLAAKAMQALQASAINATLMAALEPTQYKTQKEVNTIEGVDTPGLGESVLEAAKSGAELGLGGVALGHAIGGIFRLLKGKSPIEQMSIMADKLQEAKDSGKVFDDKTETALNDANNLVQTSKIAKGNTPTAAEIKQYVDTAKDLGFIRDSSKMEPIETSTEEFKPEHDISPVASDYIESGKLQSQASDMLSKYKDILGPDLDTALRQSKEVTFDYTSKDGTVSTRTVEPHHLGILGADEAMHGRQVFNTNDELESEPQWRNFQLKNISNLKVGERTFTKAEDYSPATSKFKEIHQTIGETGTQEADELNQFIQLAKKDKTEIPVQDENGNEKTGTISDQASELDRDGKASDIIKQCMMGGASG